MRVVLMFTAFVIVFFVLAAGAMGLLVNKRPFSPTNPFYSVQETAVNWLGDAPAIAPSATPTTSQAQEQAQNNPATNISPASIPFLQEIDHSFFALDGGHAIDCEACHSDGTFANTATICSQCHAAPADHFDGACDDCHVIANWIPTAFDHINVTECTNCHVDDAPSPHYVGDCALCHLVTTWAEVTFSHDNLTDCLSCHTAIAPINHYPGQCSACHNTTNWQETTFSHNGLTDCLSCHTAITPINHYPGQCSACHNTTNWQEVNFSHSGLTNCISCHAEPVVHAGQFGVDCARCHTTTAWTPALLLNHTFPLNHESRTNIDCVTCHQITYTTYTCYGCHEHTPDKIRAEHIEEGITNFENCIECHPTGREDEAKGGDDD